MQDRRLPVPQGISARAALVALLIPVGLSLVVTVTWPAWYSQGGHLSLGTGRIVRTMAVELFLIGTLGSWLWHLGWRPHRSATLPIESLDLLRGSGIWVASIVWITIWATCLRAIDPEFIARAVATRFVGHPPLLLTTVFSIQNAIFEEFLWLGLGVAAMRRHGLGVAFTLSVASRTLVHTYQGPLALVAVLPLGLLYTAYYVRTRRIWPVVVAHTIQDLIAFGMLALDWGHRSA